MGGMTQTGEMTGALIVPAETADMRGRAVGETCIAAGPAEVVVAALADVAASVDASAGGWRLVGGWLAAVFWLVATGRRLLEAGTMSSDIGVAAVALTAGPRFTSSIAARYPPTSFTMSAAYFFDPTPL
jgi:hypothetical protein